MGFLRSLCLVFAISVAGLAQPGVSADQLVSFIKSAVQSHQDDKKVAEQVQKIKLNSRLDAKTVEELQRLGAGPKTVAALQKLSEASGSLPAAAPPPVSAPAVIPPPTPAELKTILAEIQQNALDYTKNLPNYICSQFTKRHVDPTGTESWRLADTVLEQLSFVDQKEIYTVKMVNDKIVTNNLKHDQLGGAKSSGEFGSILHTIFDPETQTEFTWERWTSLQPQEGRLRPTYVFAFRVAQPRYSVLHEGSKRSVTVGFHGEAFADRETKRVMRVKMQCDNIPPDFPIQDVRLILYYDIVDIAGQSFVLPLASDVRSREGKYLVWNEVSYHSYHKYSADASISFGAPEDIPAEKLKEQPPPTKKQ
ncbi:MAG TPA: hypothetical protein VMH81_20735 [Bryobacteraceae bacterium]|nr:hypothetical protein [Bryobacteraceae bacterium]